MPSPPDEPPRRPRARAALALVDSLGDRIRGGRLAPGEKLPTEAEIVAEFGVSRTVVREALSRLQASRLIVTRHGIGSFVLEQDGPASFRIAPGQLATLRDVIAVLELRIGVETEAASLAARRHTGENLVALEAALDAFDAAVEAGEDAVGSDFRLHLEIARAAHNVHFAELMTSLGVTIIPRARLAAAPADARSVKDERRAYLSGVSEEHRSIVDAIASGDGEAARAAMHTHLARSRERRRHEAGEADRAKGRAGSRAPGRGKDRDERAASAGIDRRQGRGEGD